MSSSVEHTHEDGTTHTHVDGDKPHTHQADSSNNTCICGSGKRNRSCQLHGG